MTTREAMFKVRRDYVESLNEMLNVFKSFHSIHYTKTPKTDQEYVKITSLIGNSYYLDVTTEPLSDICRSVCDMVMNSKNPANRVTNRDKLIEIAKLF